MAYAAGIIDGEGCIMIAKQSSSVLYWGCGFYLRVRVSTIDTILAPWLDSTFGGHSYITKKRDGYNYPDYHWYICSDKAMRFLEKLLPYLKLKKEEALVAIQFQKQKIKSRNRGRINHLSRKFFESEKKLYWILRNLKTKFKPII